MPPLPDRAAVVPTSTSGLRFRTLLVEHAEMPSAAAANAPRHTAQRRGIARAPAMAAAMRLDKTENMNPSEVRRSRRYRRSVNESYWRGFTAVFEMRRRGYWQKVEPRRRGARSK